MVVLQVFRRRLPIISISANVREEQVAEVCLAIYLICASLMSGIDARLRHRCMLCEALQDWRSTGEYTTAHPLIRAGPPFDFSAMRSLSTAAVYRLFAMLYLA